METGDDVAFMRDLTKRTLQRIRYHERGLVEEHAKLAAMRALSLRAGLEIDDEMATDVYSEEEEDGGREAAADGVEFHMAFLLGEVMSTIKLHEEQLRNRHCELGAIKALLARGNYTEFTLAEIAAELADE